MYTSSVPNRTVSYSLVHVVSVRQEFSEGMVGRMGGSVGTYFGRICVVGVVSTGCGLPRLIGSLNTIYY